MQSDVQDLFELDSDPLVSKYLGEPVQELQETIDAIENIRQQYVDSGIGRYAVIDKATQALMGWSGLKLEKAVRDFNYYDLGYRFKPQYWGKGIATETTLASVKYGFEDLKLEEICAAADCDNNASNVVLKKAGLKFSEHFQYVDTKHNWYKIDRKGWELTSAYK